MSPIVRKRRLAVAITTAGAVLLTVTACGSDESGATTLTFATFGGAYEDAQRSAWLDEFTEETGIEVTTDAYDFAKLQAMVESGDVYWDAVDVSADAGLEGTSELLEPIDCSVVSTCDTPASGLINSDWRVATSTSGMLVGYNTDAVDGEPATWADFFDTETFPGKRGMPPWASGGALEAALLADGVAPDEIYPLDVDRALAKLDTIKNDIIWWESATQSTELLASGETAFSLTFAARVYSVAVEEQEPVAPVWDSLIAIGNYVAVPKGTENKDAAMQFAAFITEKENNAKISEYYPVGPGTEGATADVPAEIEEWLPSSHLENALPQDDNYWDKNYASVDEQFQAWLQQ